MKANQVKKNDLKESESYKKGLRAESLFRYIEMKEQELKRSRLLLLKSIVSKQRQKIAYESEKWERKLEVILILNNLQGESKEEAKGL